MLNGVHYCTFICNKCNVCNTSQINLYVIVAHIYHSQYLSTKSHEVQYISYYSMTCMYFVCNLYYMNRGVLPPSSADTTKSKSTSSSYASSIIWETLQVCVTYINIYVNANHFIYYYSLLFYI